MCFADIFVQDLAKPRRSSTVIYFALNFTMNLRDDTIFRTKNFLLCVFYHFLGVHGALLARA